MKYPIWKPIVILAVVALFLFALYPPARKLKPGIDLAGGTTLVYSVNVPPGGDPEQVIDETIAVLQERVDPTGVMNLVWRQIAGNRIEVQMPLAGQEVGERRQAYLSARDALLTGALTERAIDQAMQADTAEQQQQRIEQLAQKSGVEAQRLESLAQRYQAFREASRANEATEAAFQEAQQSLEQLSLDASDQERQSLTQAVDDLQQQLIANARAYLAARDAYQDARQGVLQSAITSAELERVLSLPNKTVSEGEPSQREQAITQLKQAHPSRAQAIDELAAAYAAYEEVKGPLDDANDLIAMLRGSGVLEFRIVGSPDLVGDVAQYRQQLQEQGPLAGRNQPWRWFVVDDIEQYAEGSGAREALQEDAEAYFEQRGIIGAAYGGQYYVLLANTPNLSITQSNEGWELTSVQRAADQLGQPALAFSMNPVGGALMSQLSGANVGRQMAILLDGRVISSPVLRSQISTNGQISGGQGGFSQQELNYLIRTLRAGSLEGTISEYPISQKTTGPELGEENLQDGLTAAVLALVIVAAFMAIYYFGLGLIANIALLLNMIIILGVMAAIQATWTLPGIAGIVLTIGMAVDANVLIFERIREELERKADFGTAVRLGYEKALSTILDANITTLITCLVLGYTASAEVKGFAVTLGIGIIATLFTALFCTRVIVDLLMIYAKVRNMPQLPSVVPAVNRALSPTVDWISKRYFFFGLSALIIAVGLGMVIARGSNMLDIEFRAGTQVSFELEGDQMLPRNEVEDRLDLYASVADRIQSGQLTGAGGLSPEEAAAYTQLVPVVQAAEQRYEDGLAAFNQAQTSNAEMTIEKPDEVRFSLLRDASVVTQGETEGNRASAFNVSTLMTDAQAVSGVIKAAFDEYLASTRPITFDNDTADRVAAAPIYPIRTANLGQVVDRPLLTRDVPEYLGGVAILLEDLDPAATTDELARRIRRMRAQPTFESLGYRPFEVIPVGDPAGATEAGQDTYSSFVVVSRDNDTDYTETPDAFTDPAGLAATEWTVVRDALQRDTSLASVTSFSSQVSATMKQQAIVAMILSLIAVVAYIWFRFGSIRYGFAAIFALVHDVAVALGLVAISGWMYNNEVAHWFLLTDFKVDIAIVAALLTIVGYSLNDTIIVFDRIRENRGRLSMETPAIINDSINQTISRTVITSGTTLLALIVLYMFGGPGVHGFAFTMLIGVLVGTYSSIAVAAPTLLLLGRGKPQSSAATKRTAA